MCEVSLLNQQLPSLVGEQHPTESANFAGESPRDQEKGESSIYPRPIPPSEIYSNREVPKLEKRVTVLMDMNIYVYQMKAVNLKLLSNYNGIIHKIITRFIYKQNLDSFLDSPR